MKLYLITPEKITNITIFLEKLDNILEKYKDIIAYLQIRLKDITYKNNLAISIKIIAIVRNYNIKVIINDNIKLMEELDADGVHLGEEDYTVHELRFIRKKYKNKIIGISCYDKITSAKRAIDIGVNQVSFGAFFPTTSKRSKGKPTSEHLHIIDKYIGNRAIEILAIGGITANNIRFLPLEYISNICIISYIWNNPQYLKAVNSLRLELSKINKKSDN